MSIENSENTENSNEGNMGELYNLLFAGKTLKLSFPSLSSAETFRTKLYRYKANQDMLMLAGEIIETKQKLSFLLQENIEDIDLFTLETPAEATIFIRNRIPPKTYKFMIIEESEESEGKDSEEKDNVQQD